MTENSDCKVLSINELFNSDNYVIPLYQRNFAWEQSDIETLIQDINQYYLDNKDSGTDTCYYIGSLTVFRRRNGEYEVIDGQQRLTVFSLIVKILGICNDVKLSFDSRPEVTEFLNEFYKTLDVSANLNKFNNYKVTQNLKSAISWILDSLIILPSKSDDYEKEKTFLTVLKNKNEISDFINFVRNRVKIVRVTVPDDTDVAAYFEIMNNRGEQLKNHEILKALLMKKLESKDLPFFDVIWNKCSQMDEHIEKLFECGDRRIIFGDDFKNYAFDDLKKEYARKQEQDANCKTTEEKNENSQNIIDILSNKFNKEEKKKESYLAGDCEDEQEYKSIIDFSNFLLHVFKIKYGDLYKIEISLDEKFLIKNYNKIENSKIDALEFLKDLLYYRVCFDRYVVKTEQSRSKKNVFHWSLKEPNNSKGKFNYKNSFTDPDNSETDYHDRILKCLSMLQVSFSSQKYKNWLQDVLKFFYQNKESKSFYIDAKDYLESLHKLIFNYYCAHKYQVEDLNDWKYKYSGRSTPHFIFNFLDYLIWYEDKINNNSSHLNNAQNLQLRDFEFKYNNSVEHHLPESYSTNGKTLNEKGNPVDNFGNLCLVTDSENSTLGDKDPKEKVNICKDVNKGPKRQYMYYVTSTTSTKWEDEIGASYEFAVNYLKSAEKILEIESKKNE